MTDLMRASLKDWLPSSLKNQPNAGLLIQRGLTQWDRDNDKPTKKKQLENITRQKASELYRQAFQRWVNLTDKHPERFYTVTAYIQSRLYTGLSANSTLETGISVQHSYGMPMLAGSGIKGAVRAYAEQIGLPENVRHILFGKDSDQGTGEAGALIWHDAWWMPNASSPFVKEIITTHHQEYYNGKQDKAEDTDSPIPNQQLATTGDFYFVIEGPKAWTLFAAELLGRTLKEQGIGGKTASGYSYLQLSNQSDRKIKADKEAKANQQKKAEEEQERKAFAQLPPLEKLSLLLSEWRKKDYQVNDGNAAEPFEELCETLQAVCQEAVEGKLNIEPTEFLSKNELSNKKQLESTFKSSKRVNAIKTILDKLRGQQT